MLASSLDLVLFYNQNCCIFLYQLYLIDANNTNISYVVLLCFFLLSSIIFPSSLSHARLISYIDMILYSDLIYHYLQILDHDFPGRAPS